MLKKIFSSLLLASVLVTQSALAVTVTPTPPSNITSYISNLEVSSDTIVASSGKGINVTFDIDAATTVDGYVTNTSTGKIATVLFSQSPMSTSSYKYKWYGTTNNTSTGNSLSVGEYLVTLVSYDNSGNVTDVAYEYVDIVTAPVANAPKISGFAVASPFDPTEETLSIEFETDQTAEVTVEILKGNTVVRSFTDYNGDTYPAGDITVEWDGKNNSGVVVADGEYEIVVTVENANGVGTADATITVESGVTPQPGNGPVVEDLKVSPKTFDPIKEDTTIEFEVSEDAYVTVEILDGNEVVREFTGYNDGNDFYNDGDFSIVWDGEDDEGDYVADGGYTVEVTAENNDGKDVEDVTVYVDRDGGNSTGIIQDVELDPEDDWNPVDEDLEITFDLDEDVDVLVVEAEEVNGNKTIEIYDEDDVDEGEVEVSFDGTEEGGDYIDEGEWDIVIYADGDVHVERITVDYDDPEIEEAFVTKDEFDVEQDEFTYLVLEVSEDAILTVDVYDGSKKEFTLVDEEDVDGDEWIVIKFDGYDDDDDELDEGDYTFRITAEGEGEGEEDVVEVDFEIEEDDVSSDKPNATNDYTEPVVFDDEEDESMDINFCIDEAAEIDLSIYEGKSASGKEEAELLDGVEFAKGCHTIVWDGTDEDGKELKKDIYSWKLIAKDGSKKDTETGRFVIGELGDDKKKPDPKPPVGQGECGGYWDTQNVGYELCDALDWLKAEGIMTGNPDGSFRPYNAINRAEMLRVTLESYSEYVTFLPANGSNFGFWDVSPYAWYAEYVRTAKFYGLFHGYLNSTEARLNQTINRVELLKFVLEGADAFTDWEKPGFESSFYADVNANDATHDWFFDYAGVAHQYGLFDGTYYLHPGSYVNRGEAALVLYRMHKAGLIK